MTTQLDTSAEKEAIVKGYCPTCCRDQLSTVCAESNHCWEDDIYPVSLFCCFRILQCRGCEAVYFQKTSHFSEDDPEDVTVTYWPAPSKRNPMESLDRVRTADERLESLLSDIYVALNNDLGVLSAMGIRTAFDRCSELLGVDPHLPFGQKLEQLQISGKIGMSERGILDVLIDAGSAAAHRGWKPSPPELNTMMSTLETFIYRNFILGHEVIKLEASVPPRPPRPPKQASTAPKIT